MQLDGSPVVIRRFFDASEAEMARGYLESSGIPCVLLDQHHYLTQPVTGGVRLAVSESDARQAQKLLDELPQAASPGS